MTLSSDPAKEIKNGNDVTTVFSFTFEIDTASDMVAIHRDSAGVETTITEGTGTANYSISVANYPGNGSVTYPATLGTELATGETLTLARIVDIDQETDLQNQSKYKPETVEATFDYSRMIDLQQQDQLDRSIKAPISDDSGADYTLPTPTADTVIAIWDSAGTALVAGPTSAAISGADSSATAAAASAAAALVSENAAAASAVDSAASAGAVKVSSDDTTPGDLETKILSSGLAGLSTQSGGGNETRTVDVPIASQAQAEAGTNNTTAITPLRSAQAIAALAGGGGLVLLATATASASSSVDFTSGIDSTYDRYIIHISRLFPATNGAVLHMRTSTDAGTSFDAGVSDYGWNKQTRNNSSAYSGSFDGTAAEIELTDASISNDEYITGVVEFDSPSSVQRFSIKSACWATRDATGSDETRGNEVYGQRKTAADVNAIRFIMSTGNITSGEFKLYGVQKS